MRRGKTLICVLAGLVMAQWPSYGAPLARIYSAAGVEALAWARRIVKLGPRYPGSRGHARLQQLLVGELGKTRAELIEDDFTARTPNGPIAMKNIIAKFPGTSDDIVVVSGHYDTFHRPGLHFVGANDGGSSTAFLLALAGLLNAHPRKDQVWLLFFDGEESIARWNREDHTYGSRHLAQRWGDDGTLGKMKALINVDMIGDADLSLTSEQLSTPWLRELVRETARGMGYGSLLSDRRLDCRRPCAFPTGRRHDHVPFLQAGAVNLIDFHYGPRNRYWHTENDTAEKLSLRSFTVMIHLVDKVLDELESVP